MGAAILATSCHVAHLDPISGTGLLIMPLERDDLTLPAPANTAHLDLDGETIVATIPALSLHKASLSLMFRSLAEIGYEPLEDEWGDLLIHGTTGQGNTVIALTFSGPDGPICGMPSLEEIGTSLAALEVVAKVVERR